MSPGSAAEHGAEPGALVRQRIAGLVCSEPARLVGQTLFRQAFAAVPAFAIWRNHMAYGALIFGSDQNTVLPRLKRNFTPSWRVLKPQATTLPKARPASALRPRCTFARSVPFSVRGGSPRAAPAGPGGRAAHTAVDDLVFQQQRAVSIAGPGRPARAPWCRSAGQPELRPGGVRGLERQDLDGVIAGHRALAHAPRERRDQSRCQGDRPLRRWCCRRCRGGGALGGRSRQGRFDDGRRCSRLTAQPAGGGTPEQARKAQQRRGRPPAPRGLLRQAGAPGRHAPGRRWSSLAVSRGLGSSPPAWLWPQCGSIRIP